jgi:hypothetical protein
LQKGFCTDVLDDALFYFLSLTKRQAFIIF